MASYSKKFKGYIRLNDLKKKIFVHDKISDAIPYKTLYYSNDWGFCLSKNDYKKFFNNPNEIFYVNINTKFIKGKMNYGEFYIKGESKREILFSTYICHPNLANNELSGPVLASKLIKYFKNKKLRYSVRFLFLPETIGPIAYLNKNYLSLKKFFSRFYSYLLVWAW